jgi:hypothetical protein
MVNLAYLIHLAQIAGGIHHPRLARPKGIQAPHQKQHGSGATKVQGRNRDPAHGLPAALLPDQLLQFLHTTKDAADVFAHRACVFNVLARLEWVPESQAPPGFTGGWGVRGFWILALSMWQLRFCFLPVQRTPLPIAQNPSVRYEFHRDGKEVNQ